MAIVMRISLVLFAFAVSTAQDCPTPGTIASLSELFGKIDRWQKDLVDNNERNTTTSSSIAIGLIASDSAHIFKFFNHTHCLLQQKPDFPISAVTKQSIHDAIQLTSKLKNFTLGICRNVSMELNIGLNADIPHPKLDDAISLEETERAMGIAAIENWLDFARHHFNDKAYKGQHKRKMALNESCDQHEQTFNAFVEFLKSVKTEPSKLRYSVDQCNLLQHLDVCVALYTETLLDITNLACDRDITLWSRHDYRQNIDLEPSLALPVLEIVREDCDDAHRTALSSGCVLVRLFNKAKEAHLKGTHSRRSGEKCGEQKIFMSEEPVTRGKQPFNYTLSAGSRLALHSSTYYLKDSNTVLLYPSANADIVCVGSPGDLHCEMTYHHESGLVDSAGLVIPPTKPTTTVGPLHCVTLQIHIMWLERLFVTVFDLGRGGLCGKKDMATVTKVAEPQTISVPSGARLWFQGNYWRSHMDYETKIFAPSRDAYVVCVLRGSLFEYLSCETQQR